MESKSYSERVRIRQKSERHIIKASISVSFPGCFCLYVLLTVMGPNNSDTQSTRGWVTSSLLPPRFYLREHMSLSQKSKGVS